MATVVQSVSATIDSGGTYTINFPSPLTVGNDVIVVFNYFNGVGDPITGVTVDGQAATQVLQNTAQAPTVFNLGEIWLKTNIAGGGTSVTFVFAATGPFMVAGAMEVAGLTATPGDAATYVSVFDTPASGTPSVTSGVPSQKAELYVGFMVPISGLAYTLTDPTGWSNLYKEEDGVNHEPGIASYKFISSVAAQTATWATAPDDEAIASIAGFKVTGPADSLFFGSGTTS